MRFSNRNTPAAGNGRGVNINHNPAGLHQHFNPNLPLLLNRLEYVRRTGNSFRARCPVHQGKSRDSLKITPCEDGRILVYCFSQECSPLEILKVCGLEISDIMPVRIIHNATPAEKRKWREGATMRDWERARSTIQNEARVVLVAGKQIRDGTPLNDDDDKRLDEALCRITHAGRVLNDRHP